MMSPQHQLQAAVSVCAALRSLLQPPVCYGGDHSHPCAGNLQERTLWELLQFSHHVWSES